MAETKVFGSCEALKAAFEEGRLSVEGLLEIVENQQRTIKALKAEIDRLKQRLAQYEPEINREATPRNNACSTTSTQCSTLTSQYSLEAEEKRRRKRRRKRKSPGRKRTELKFADASRYELRRCLSRRYRSNEVPADPRTDRVAVGRWPGGAGGYRVFGVHAVSEGLKLYDNEQHGHGSCETRRPTEGPSLVEPSCVTNGQG